MISSSYLRKIPFHFGIYTWTLKFSHASATFWIESFVNGTQYYRLLLLLLLYYLGRRCVCEYMYPCIYIVAYIISITLSIQMAIVIFFRRPPLIASVDFLFSSQTLDCTRVPSFANIHIHIEEYFNFLAFGHQIDTVQYVPFHKLQFSSVLFCSFHFFYLFIWTSICHIKKSIPNIMSLWLPKRAKIFMLRLWRVEVVRSNGEHLWIFVRRK